MVENKFQHQSSAIASYDYQDIANGNGYVVFYAGDTVSENLLVPNAFTASSGVSQGDTTTLAFTATINQPINVQGKLILTVPIFKRNEFSSPQDITLSITPVIKKNTTTLATGTQVDLGASSVTNGQSFYYSRTWSLDIAFTHFKKGDTLSVTFTIAISQSQGSEVSGILHNPTGTDITGWTWQNTFVSSALVMRVPFKIDI